LGLCKLGTGGTADAVPLLTRAIDGCRATGDLPAEAAWRAHLDHALVLLQRTEWRARELRRFVEVVRALGDEAGTASLLCELGNTLREVRDLEGSAAAHAASLAISEARGDAHAASIDHANLGWTALAADDLDAAHAAFRRALELAAPDAPHRPAVAEILTRLDQRPT
ncbi:MAG: hypothetical protein KC583_20400, partial [Myxococcales bacterium]|nr:hypothetical protein [Myxococcales bacterium]